MASKAKVAKNAKLQRGNGSTPTETFTTIGEITDTSGPDETAPQLEVTSFDSVAKEYAAGLVDSGEVPFTMNFVGDDAQQQGLRTDLRAGTVRNFKLIIPDRATEAACSTCTFAAIVTKLSGPKMGVDKVITQDCTLKVSGQPTWAYAS
jgi:hypothetical protein